MKFKKIDEINHFGNAIFFWCIVDDIPKKYIDKAKMMDENDCPCFYACLIFDECGLHFNQQKGGEMYYIGTDGSPYYIENVVFTEDEAKTFYKGCFETFIKYIPRDGDKILSVAGNLPLDEAE